MISLFNGIMISKADTIIIPAVTLRCSSFKVLKLTSYKIVKPQCVIMPTTQSYKYQYLICIFCTTSLCRLSNCCFVVTQLWRIAARLPLFKSWTVPMPSNCYWSVCIRRTMFSGYSTYNHESTYWGIKKRNWHRCCTDLKLQGKITLCLTKHRRPLFFL